MWIQVVRCFEDNDIIHVHGKVDPRSDIDVINLELVFSDLDQVHVNLVISFTYEQNYIPSQFRVCGKWS